MYLVMNIYVQTILLMPCYVSIMQQSNIIPTFRESVVLLFTFLLAIWGSKVCLIGLIITESCVLLSSNMVHRLVMTSR